METDDSGPHFGATGRLGYERLYKKIHLIMEFRTDDFKICTPKKVTHKPHFWSGKQTWLVHYRKGGRPDIRRLG